jgi:branched-chain amino acid aminotransferase
MLTIKWNDKTGWQSPQISEYAPLHLDPSCVVFHYAIECFEGMKAYKDKDSNIRLFRPDMNMKRLNSSCKRLTLPAFNEEELLKCLKTLVKVDDHWIPKQRG